MTARTVRTSSTKMRAPRLAMLLALVVTSLGALGASAFVAPPAGAAASVALFRPETYAIASWNEPGGSLNNLRATFVIESDSALSITGYKQARGTRSTNDPSLPGSYTAGLPSGSTTRTVSGPAGSGKIYTIVEYQFSPGTGNWAGLTDGGSICLSNNTRETRPYAEIQLNTNHGELPMQQWRFWTAASGNDGCGAQDYPVFENNHGTVNGTVFNSGNVEFPLEYTCDDADSTGSDGQCDQVQLRLRNLNTDQRIPFNCDTQRRSGDGCEDRNGSPYGAWNADDNSRRNHIAGYDGLARGKWVIEGIAAGENNSYNRSDDWAWLGMFYVNPSAPTLTVTSGTDTRSDGSYHPNTGANITYTANVSGDGQVLDWDADLNTGNGLEARENATMSYGGNAGGVPSFTTAQRQRTIATSSLAAGAYCGVRAQLRDSGSLAATDTPTAGHSQQTGVVAPSCVTNRIPTGGDKSVDAHQGTQVPINLDNTDADGADDTLTCEITDQPDTGSLAGAATSCSRPYTANLGADRTDTFKYRVKDDHNGVSAEYTVTINITNAAPVAEAQDIVVYAGEPTPLPMNASDADGDPITSCTVTTSPTKGTLSGSGCSQTYTSSSDGPNQGKGGTDLVAFTATDGNETSDPAPIDITLRNPNLSVTKAHTGRFNEGSATGTYTITVSNSNTAPAYGTTTITDTLPAGMTFSSAIVGTSDFSCAGTAVGATTVTCTRTTVIPRNSSVQVQLVVDVAAGTASPSVNSVTVTNPYELATTAGNNTGTDTTAINRPPTMVDQTVATASGTPITVTFSGTDPNGDALTYATNSPAHGTVSGTGASRTYTPDAGYVGVDTFAVQATDTGTPGLTATATVTVWVGVRPIEGTVTSEQTGAPLEGIQVWLVDNADPQNATVDQVITTGADGSYDFGLVPLGTYAIRWYDTTETYISEFYLNAKNRQLGTNTVLTAGTTPVVRDAELTAGAIITGTVASEADGHAPAEGIQVRLVRAGQTGGSARDTDAAGAYEYRLLTAGTYQVWFRETVTDRFYSEWYTGSADQDGATTITLVAGQTATIDELLTPVPPPPPPDSGVITGRVTSAGPGNSPIAGIQVRAYREPYTGSVATTTDANGEYSFTRLPPGNWKIWFRDVAGANYVSQYNGNASTLDDSDAFSLNNDTEVVNVQLAPKVTTTVTPLHGIITGTVTEADGVTPVVGLQVRIYVAGQTANRAVTTDANGVYTFTKVTPGSYQVWFRDLGKTWLSEWHLDKPGQVASDPVPATAGEVTAVDARLTRR